MQHLRRGKRAATLVRVGHDDAERSLTQPRKSDLGLSVSLRGYGYGLIQRGSGLRQARLHFLPEALPFERRSVICLSPLNSRTPVTGGNPFFGLKEERLLQQNAA